MIAKPPFYLYGQTGKSLGAYAVPFEVLDIQDGVLRQRSLDVDELTFSQRAQGGVIIPDDEQWITLLDDDGRRLFTGICKRAYSYQDRIYSFTATNVYKGMMETPLLDGNRAFVLYPEQDLGTRLLAILNRGIAAGLPVQAPSTMPALFLVPKQAFRSQSIASALEDAMKWAPDCTTRMDYDTQPPTLRFYARGEATARVIDLDSDGHQATDVTLTPYPEARAKSVSFAYARRSGNNVVSYLVQTAGDDAAEAGRTLSLYLSGQERSDMLVTEALTTAQKAVAMAQASVDAVGATIDAAAATASLPLSWETCVARNTTLQAAVTASPGFTMSPDNGGLYELYIYSSPTYDFKTSHAGTPLSLTDSGGYYASGWYPIATGAFTAQQLAEAGATKETRYIRGDLFRSHAGAGSNAGMNYLETNDPANCETIDGYIEQTYNSDQWTANRRHYLWYRVNIAVDAINMSPAAVAAAIKAKAAAGSSAFIERAEFVEAPPSLAKNYFNRQDWTPYKGSVSLTPSAPELPAPGEFISITGEAVEPGWKKMMAPVAERSIDLQTLESTITIGPSPRMAFSSLVDRLRIPQEDNYEPG